MIKILLKPKIDQNTPYTKKMIEILPKPKNWTKMTKMSIFRFKGVFKGLISELTHVLSVGLVTLLGSGCVQGVASGTQHWATWSNGYRRIFKPTKPLKPKSKNHDNGWINMLYVFDIITLIIVVIVVEIK